MKSKHSLKKNPPTQKVNCDFTNCFAQLLWGQETFVLQDGIHEARQDREISEEQDRTHVKLLTAVRFTPCCKHTDSPHVDSTIPEQCHCLKARPTKPWSLWAQTDFHTFLSKQWPFPGNWKHLFTKGEEQFREDSSSLRGPFSDCLGLHSHQSWLLFRRLVSSSAICAKKHLFSSSLCTTSKAKSSWVGCGCQATRVSWRHTTKESTKKSCVQCLFFFNDTQMEQKCFVFRLLWDK